MGPSRFAVVLGAALLAVLPAREGIAEVAELDEIALLNAEIHVAACARYDQFFSAYDLAFLVPELRETVLGRIGEQGASAAQRDRLARLYDATLAESAASGLAAGSRKAELTPARLAVLEAEADRVLAFCDRWVFTLAQVRPAPEEPAPEERKASSNTMDRLRWLVWQCGLTSVFSSKSGFDSLYPNFREVTLENARRHNASEAQIEELAQRFDESVLTAQNVDTDWEAERQKIEHDNEHRQYVEKDLDQSYSYCASENFDND